MGLVLDMIGTIAIPEIVQRYHILPVIHLILIGLEALLIGLYLFSAYQLGGAASLATSLVISGPLRVVFWAFVVLPGLFIPFMVHVYAIGAGRHSPVWGIVSGVCIVMAGLFLRYLIISPGVPALL